MSPHVHRGNLFWLARSAWIFLPNKSLWKGLLSECSIGVLIKECEQDCGNAADVWGSTARAIKSTILRHLLLSVTMFSLCSLSSSIIVNLPYVWPVNYAWLTIVELANTRNVYDIERCTTTLKVPKSCNIIAESSGNQRLSCKSTRPM